MTDTNTPIDPVAAKMPKPGQHFWSPSKCAFYVGDLYMDYLAARSWPADAVLLDEAVYASFQALNPPGKTLGVGADGMPAWIAPPPISSEDAATYLGKRVDQALDQFAATWGYTQGIDRATTWVNSSNPQYAAEAKALAKFRDDVWDWAVNQPVGTVTMTGAPTAPERPQVDQEDQGSNQ